MKECKKEREIVCYEHCEVIDSSGQEMVKSERK